MQLFEDKQRYYDQICSTPFVGLPLKVMPQTRLGSPVSPARLVGYSFGFSVRFYEDKNGWVYMLDQALFFQQENRVTRGCSLRGLESDRKTPFLPGCLAAPHLLHRKVC